MSSFPTSIFSPSARSNGQVIDASHVGDLQDEVVAVETDIKSGFTNAVKAPAGSQAAPSLTFTGDPDTGLFSVATNQLAMTAGGANIWRTGNPFIEVRSDFTFQWSQSAAVTDSADVVLSRSAAATFAIATGGVTAVTVDSSQVTTFAKRPVLTPPDAALVFLDSSGAIASSAGSTLAWKSEAYLTNSSLHSTGTNPERLTPQSTGLYRFTAQVNFPGVGSGSNPASRQLLLRDSSGFFANTFHNSSEAVTMQVVGYKRVDTPGTFITVAFAQNGASTNSLSSGVENSWFAMEKL